MCVYDATRVPRCCDMRCVVLCCYEQGLDVVFLADMLWVVVFRHVSGYDVSFGSPMCVGCIVVLMVCNY